MRLWIWHVWLGFLGWKCIIMIALEFGRSALLCSSLKRCRCRLLSRCPDFKWICGCQRKTKHPRSVFPNLFCLKKPSVKIKQLFISTKPEMCSCKLMLDIISVISNTIIIVTFWTETDFLSEWGAESHFITAFSLIAVWSKSKSFHVLCLGITVVDTFGRAEAIIFLRLPYDFMQVNRCLVCFLIIGRCVDFLCLITSDCTIHSSIYTMH